MTWTGTSHDAPSPDTAAGGWWSPSKIMAEVAARALAEVAGERLVGVGHRGDVARSEIQPVRLLVERVIDVRRVVWVRRQHARPVRLVRPRRPERHVC